MRRIREIWRREIGLGLIFTHATAARLAAVLDQPVQPAGPMPDPASEGLQSPLPLRAGPADAPMLACVHPAGGLSWCYRHLAQALDPARAVYGVQASLLRAGARAASTLDDMAADYIAQLRRLQPDGPYHLCGWSVGGIIAQAMAAQLEAAGASVGVLALLDAYPGDRWRNAADVDERAALRALLLMADEDPDAVPGELTRARVVDRLRRGHHPLSSLSDSALAGVLRVVEHNNRLVRRHRHTPCAATVIHFKAALDHAGDGCSPEEWRPYAGAIDAHIVPTIHAHMTGPAASRLVARVLSERMRA